MRWRRRRFQRIRRRERKKWERPSGIVVKEHRDGETTVKEYRLPRADVPRGVPVWNPRIGKAPKLEPGGVMVMQLEIDAVFHKCEVCGAVWQKPHRHTRAECRGTVVFSVMES